MIMKKKNLLGNGKFNYKSTEFKLKMVNPFLGGKEEPDNLMDSNPTSRALLIDSYEYFNQFKSPES